MTRRVRQEEKSLEVTFQSYLDADAGVSGGGKNGKGIT